MYREKGSSAACSSGKREITITGMLFFIKDKVWKYLFGKPADEVKEDKNDETQIFQIVDNDDITNRFIPEHMADVVPSECAFFMAGIVEGILVSSNMDCKVIACFDKI